MDSRSRRLSRVVRRWLESAEEDRTAVRALSALGTPRALGFHAQQAVEKLIKAVLISYDVQPEETHAVGVLLGQLHRLDRSLVDSLGPVDRLTPYAVRLRYPPSAGAHDRQVSDGTAAADAALASEACEKLDAAISARLRVLEGDAA